MRSDVPRRRPSFLAAALSSGGCWALALASCAGTPVHETARGSATRLQGALDGVVGGARGEVERTGDAVRTAWRLIGPWEFERIEEAGHASLSARTEMNRLDGAAGTAASLFRREMERLDRLTTPRRASPQDSLPQILR